MKDTVNMFGGSPLNRLSWLRSSPAFLNGIAASPKTRWILFNAGQPLLQSNGSLAFLSTVQVRQFLGQEPLFNQGQTPGSFIPAEQASNFTEAARHLGSPIVFLGLHESSANGHGALPSSDFSSKSNDAESVIAKIDGTPYFSMEVADLEVNEDDMNKSFVETGAVKEGEKLSWGDPRALMNTMLAFEGAVYAEARSMTDWNWRNKFCPACGSKQYSLWGGWKTACSSLLPWADNSNRKPCPSGKGLHNYAHPRTDCVVIMCAIDQTGQKILLGRSRRFPIKFYSALAGFIEPGETFEDAVRREMWEEAGVSVWDVTYHSGQPWPYPANLMCGFYARADSSKPVRVDLDNELADAQWYTREDILQILGHSEGTKLDYKKITEMEKKELLGKKNNKDMPSVWTENDDEKAKKEEEKKKEAGEGEPPFRIPPTTAIAGVLIRDWATGRVQFPPVEVGQSVGVANL
ncbi:NADH pyrophosphatase [Stygiomarasmius scandens]|uniref:NAD(+) diphosphatase n=1 Tax=Marasmiellus scandens TaxID=2682957 RepID=A0ABR1K4S0_9AGAR